MPEFVTRLAILAALGVLSWLIVAVSRIYINGRKRQALAAEPLTEGATSSTIRILAFSTETCRQCHTHQWPAIQRVVALRPERVVGEDIDATNHPDLVARYHILTVPSTVVLDGHGNVQAVNYGFVNTQGLLKQIDALA